MTVTPPASASEQSPSSSDRQARFSATSDDEHAVSTVIAGPWRPYTCASRPDSTLIVVPVKVPTAVVGELPDRVPPLRDELPEPVRRESSARIPAAHPDDRDRLVAAHSRTLSRPRGTLGTRDLGAHEPRCGLDRRVVEHE